MLSKIKWSLFVITTNIVLSKASNIVQNLNLTNLCPNTRFCTQNASSNFNRTGKQPCCSLCLCTNDCQMYGNCCPGAKHHVYRKFLIPECFFPVYNIDFETQDLHDNYIFTGINSYNAFTKCPELYDNDTVRDMCEGIPTRLGDFALVSNEQGHVYKNKHCAYCHGIDKYLSWSLKMKCLTSENAENFVNALPIVKNNSCMIWSFPQNAEIGRRSLCFRANDACQIHGSLRNACLSYTLYYFHNFRGLIFLFRNVHCFACKHSESLLKESCTLMTTDDVPKLYQFSLPITAFLNVDLHRQDVQTRKLSNVKTCLKSEIYDSYFNKCRILDCPLMSIASYGRCVSYYNKIIGFSISILVDFISISNEAEFKAVKTLFDQSDQSKYSWFYTNIASTFINSTKETMKECDICRTDFLENGTLMYLNIQFHTNTICTVDDLHSYLYKYSQQSHRFYISIEGKLYAFMTRVNLSNLENIPRMITKFRLKYTVCDNPIRFTGDRVCPTITLKEPEYHTLMKMRKYPGKVLEREITNLTNDIKRYNNTTSVSTGSIFKNITKSFDVCLNEYNMFINVGSSISKPSLLGVSGLLIIFPSKQ